MALRKKMNAEEMEKWLLSQGAMPVTEEMKKEPCVCGGVETASMHDAGKETAHRPPKGSRKTLNCKTPAFALTGDLFMDYNQSHAMRRGN